MHLNSHLGLLCHCIFQCSSASILCVDDAIDKMVYTNGIIVDVQEPDSGVNWGSLLITTGRVRYHFPRYVFCHGSVV